MNGGYFSIYREAENKINCYIADAIYLYLCKHATFMPKPYKIADQIELNLAVGQFVTSAEKIHEYLKSKKGMKESLSTIKRRIKMLEDLELIEIEKVKQGRRIVANIFTIKNVSDPLKNIEIERSPALEPQGIEPISERSAQNDFERSPALEPQGVQQKRERSKEQFERSTERSPALEPQGIEQYRERSLERSIINKKELNKKELKDLKDLKQQQKIPQPESFVNTFAEIYSYFEKRVSKRPTPAQIEQLGDFFDSGMQPDLLKAIMDKAGESATTSAPKYFIDTCRDLLKNHIVTLDNWLQSAAKYKKRDQQQTKQNGQTQRQRTNMPRSDSNYQDLGF